MKRFFYVFFSKETSRSLYIKFFLLKMRKNTITWFNLSYKGLKLRKRESERARKKNHSKLKFKFCSYENKNMEDILNYRRTAHNGDSVSGLLSTVSTTAHIFTCWKLNFFYLNDERDSNFTSKFAFFKNIKM